MDETVNTIENGDPKQTLSDDLIEANVEIDISIANNTTKCTEDSSVLLIVTSDTHPPSENNASEDSQGHLSEIVEETVVDSSSVLSNESPAANENMEDAGSNSQLQDLIVEGPVSCVKSTDGKESPIIVTEQTTEADNIGDKNISDSEPKTTELTVVKSTVEASSATASNVTVVTDDKMENIESELSILTGDSSPSHPPNLHKISLNNGQEKNSPVENESIISELSVIHGEETENTAHNGGNINRFPFRLTTEDIQKSYDKNISVQSQENSLVDTLLTFIDGKGKSDTSQETAVMDNLDLLAILEGGGDSPSPLKEETNPLRRDIPPKKFRKSVVNMDPILEKTLALKQLKQLPTRKKMKETKRIVDVKIPKVFKGPALMGRQRSANKSASEEGASDKTSPVPLVPVIRKEVPVKTYSKKNASNDISNLINDWNDDDVNKETADQTVAESPCPTKDPTPTDNISLPKESAVETPKSQDVPKSDSFVEPTPKRVSRVIKKKVIYDPDNPDSYKFASSIIKKDKPDKKDQEEQDENAKVNDHTQKTNITKTKSKVPVSKTISAVIGEMLVKVPKRASVSPINKKKVLNTSMSKKKKLSEVDRLLMDEGAVNMMYQLERSNNGSDVPELVLKPNKKSLISLSKERKALVSKAKIIKQSVMSQSNDDSSIKLMRVRKETKTSTSLEVAAAKVAGLRSSMQSPSLSEMSAAGNESKIIRRHSSSSFSSGGLSPRPQSPVLERRGRKNSSNVSLDQSHLENDSGIQSSTPLAPGEVGKAKGLLLHSPAQRKRKSLENIRASVRQKKVKSVKKLDNGNRLISSPGSGLGKLSSFTQLTIDISDNIAHIVVKPTGNSEELYDLQVLSELTEAVRVSNSAGAVLLTSGDGALCGGLDLRCLLQPTEEQQRASADQLVDTFSELMVSLCECRAAVVCGVGGACTGPGVALLTLCDLALASDRATFCVAPRPRRALPPEGAALLARPHALPPQVARELVMCGRKLTASEALQRGLVARTLWPDRFLEEVRSIAADLAQHPSQSFGVIKSVLRRGEVSSISAALHHESRQLVDLWSSPLGQEAIRETHAHL